MLCNGEGSLIPRSDYRALDKGRYVGDPSPSSPVFRRSHYVRRCPHRRCARLAGPDRVPPGPNAVHLVESLYLRLSSAAQCEGVNRQTCRALVLTATAAVLALTACSGASDEAETTTDTSVGAESVAPISSAAPPVTEAPSADDAAPPIESSVQSTPPWASGVFYEDPVAAAEAFMSWLEATVAGLDPWTISYEPPPVSASIPSDELGWEEVTVTYTPFTFNETVGNVVQPTTTIRVTRSGPDNGWEVSEARSGSLQIGLPQQSDEQIGSTFEMNYFNALISNAPELRIFADGSERPIFMGEHNGGGVFAAGLYSAVIDMTACEPEDTSTLQGVSICEGPSATDEQGTLVITTDHGVTAQRVVFK